MQIWENPADIPIPIIFIIGNEINLDLSKVGETLQRPDNRNGTNETWRLSRIRGNGELKGRPSWRQEEQNAARKDRWEYTKERRRKSRRELGRREKWNVPVKKNKGKTKT